MAATNLTREEARERAELLTVQSYEVDLDLTRGDREFGSTCVIRFTAARAGAETFLDVIAERIESAELNGVPLDLSGYAGGRLAVPGLAEDNVLTLSGTFAYSNECIGMNRCTDQADGKVYLYTSFTPSEARRVFANFDQPDLKAAFTYTVTAPAHWTVLSNQPTPQPTPQPQPQPAGDEPAGDGAACWRFEPTPRLPAYVTAIVAGEYTYIGGSHTTRRGKVIPLGIAARASLAEHLEPDDVFRITAAGLDFFADLFDMDLPYAKYDQIFVPEFFAEAMENVGCVTFDDGHVFRSRTAASRYEVRAMVIMHEMAHQWFGDYVTMRWWDDIWLNESFAELCGFLATAEATEFTEAWASFAGGRKPWGYAQDQKPSSHPIVADAPTLDAAMANFDGISYAKGASVLKLLLAKVGREAFFAGVRDYFGRYAWGNAELADLLSALERSSGQDLQAWAGAWLETAGPNTLRAEFELDADGRYRSFAVLQTAPDQFPTLREHHLVIGFYDRVGESLAQAHRVEVSVSGARTDLPELIGRAAADLVLLNDEDLDYALIRLDPRSWRTLAGGTDGTGGIGGLDSQLSRAVVWAAALDAVQDAEMSVPDFYEMVATGIRTEPSVSTLDDLTRLTYYNIRAFADPRWLGTGDALLADASLDLLRAAEPGSDHQLTAARCAASVSTTDEQLEFLAGLLDGTVSVPGFDVHQELRWLILSRLAATGRCGDAEIDAELSRDDTETGLRLARRARASIPDAAHKAAAWALLTETEELGNRGVTELAWGLWDPSQSELLAPYAEAYFECLPKLWADRSEVIRMSLVTSLFPYACAGPELLAEAERFLADPELDPSLARHVVEGVDVVRRILRSRALG